MHKMHETTELLGEIGAILASGLQRLVARQSSAELADSGESSLHFSLGQSGDAAETEGGETA